MKTFVALVALLAISPAVIAAGTESCSKTSTSVQCVLSSSASSIDLSTVLADAQALSAGITASTPMVIVAYGGAGAAGWADGSTPGGALGAGGKAQMVTTLASFKSTYGATTIYYYLGTQGDGNHSGGKGGSSTIVSTANLSSTAATTANVLLIAGGGGGGSGASEGGHVGVAGGSGGTAVSSVGKAASGAGQNGTSYTTAHGGGGGGGGANGYNGSVIIAFVLN